jgi:hypothetical protein
MVNSASVPYNQALIIRSVVGSPVYNKSKSRVGRWLNLLQMWNINCAENARTPNEQKLVDAAVIFSTFLKALELYSEI